MADPARLTGGIVPRIMASWRRPGRVVRGLSPMPEGAMLAILGGLLGTVLAVGFAQMMVVGLRSVWLGAVGAPSPPAPALQAAPKARAASTITAAT